MTWLGAYGILACMAVYFLLQIFHTMSRNPMFTLPCDMPCTFNNAASTHVCMHLLSCQHACHRGWSPRHLSSASSRGFQLLWASLCTPFHSTGEPYASRLCTTHHFCCILSIMGSVCHISQSPKSLSRLGFQWNVVSDLAALLSFSPADLLLADMHATDLLKHAALPPSSPVDHQHMHAVSYTLILVLWKTWRLTVHPRERERYYSMYHCMNMNIPS